jgi:hypothetical protein
MSSFLIPYTAFLLLLLKNFTALSVVNDVLSGTIAKFYYSTVDWSNIFSETIVAILLHRLFALRCSFF